MADQIQPFIQKQFESIKHVDENGLEYWEARELMPVLEYSEWRNFTNLISKAQESCKKSGQNIEYHFVDVNKMIKIATGTDKEAYREVNDYKLSRYACYLIAQNGDPSKTPIALAQTYFAIQTRKQEIFDNLGEAEKRVFIRHEVKDSNKKLFDTAQDVGVTNFGTFNDFGYRGLYNMTSQQIKEKKQLGKDNILDRAGTTELAANLFRITQTQEKLHREKTKIKGAGHANLIHMSVGDKVRKSIAEIGGTMPENLPPEEHIEQIEKQIDSQKVLDTPKKLLNK